MATYKITAVENIPFDIRDGYEIVTDENNEGILRKKLPEDKDFNAGDFVAIIEKGVVSKIAIFKEYTDRSYENFAPFAYMFTITNGFVVPPKTTSISVGEDIRRATEDEVKKLKALLKVYRWEWNSDLIQLDKLHPYPEVGESYYYIGFDTFSASTMNRTNNGEVTDETNIQAGNYFFELESPRELAQNINKLIADAKEKRPK